MRIEKLEEARFIQRLNRFLVEIELAGLSDDSGKSPPKRTLAHLRDPGRLRELLTPGAKILVRRVEGERRKTSFEVVAVRTAARTGKIWVLVNSGLHPQLGEVALHALGCSVIRKEFRVASSRFDFLSHCGKASVVVETKGCTLVRDGTAYFPDAPTERGARHLKELAELEKYHRLVLFLVVREDADRLRPNREMDGKFGQAFDEALESGVEMKAAKFRLSYHAGILDVELANFIPVER